MLTKCVIGALEIGSLLLVSTVLPPQGLSAQERATATSTSEEAKQRAIGRAQVQLMGLQIRQVEEQGKDQVHQLEQQTAEQIEQVKAEANRQVQQLKDQLNRQTDQVRRQVKRQQELLEAQIKVVQSQAGMAVESPNAGRARRQTRPPEDREGKLDKMLDRLEQLEKRLEQLGGKK
jgi:hypothetical protein